MSLSPFSVLSNQTYAPKKPKGLSLGLGFQFFEYLSFKFGFDYIANLLQISNEIMSVNYFLYIFLRMELQTNINAFELYIFLLQKLHGLFNYST